MSAKARSNPLNGAHTAGIFSDLSVDGPVIGTLVLVVDRAKNLPNRKTIGKQDPYCAARLGKEAKKTNTDIRGGQTPRWDQELRFVVHESPDYFQLKVSVFSDDKKTELIGENWIDLRDIIVSGGGQSDKWHTLNYRGKYAGEIRIEITYYDSRPKRDKPAAVSATARTAASTTGSARGRTGGEPSASGTLGPRAPNGPKRRPLPSDPVTGQQPSPAAPAPQPQPQSAAQPPAPMPQAIHGASLPAESFPTMGQQQMLPEHAQTPPRPQPNLAATYTPSQSPLPANSYTSTPPQPVLYQQQQPQPQPQPQLRQMSQQHPPSEVPPVRYAGYNNDEDAYAAGHDATQYELPPPGVHHQDHRHQHRNGHHSHHSQSHDRSQYSSREFTPEFYDQQQQQQQQQQQPLQLQQQPYDLHEDPRGYHFDAPPTHTPEPAMALAYGDANFAQPVDDRPPPPPVHRSRNNSNGTAATDAMFRTSFDSSTQPTMRREVLRSEAHRHSVSSVYPGRPTYRPLEASPVPSAPAPEPSYQPSPPRHLASQGSAYEPPYTAEPDNAYRPSLPPQQQPQAYPEPTNYEYSSPGFNKVPSPAPLNVGAHRSSATSSPAPMYTPSTPTHPGQAEPTAHARRSPSPLVSHDYNQTSPSPQPGRPAASAYGSYDPYDEPYQNSHTEPEGLGYAEGSDAYVPPPVPASLVPGVGPSLALELRSRIHGEQQQQQHPPPLQQRYTFPSQSVVETPPKATPPRGRPALDEPPRTSLDYDHAPQAYTPQRSLPPQSYQTPPQPRYDRSPGPYSSGVPSPAVAAVQKGASPNPRHTIKRKSVSPAPAVTPSNNERRLSGVPFGPDSYDALNPALAASKDPSRPDFNEASGKIIAFDGSEIDPSDHLPVESWAPEPEPKPNSTESATASPAQYSTPMSGKKQLRVAGRPQSSMGSSGVTFSSADDPGTTYTPTARNRLQKKANRQSVAGVPVSSGGVLASGSPQGSTPLAPLTQPRQQQDNFTPPRALVRASTYDYANENHAPALYGSSPGRPSFGNSVPPVPAKVSVGADGTGVGGGYASGSPYGTGSYRGRTGSYTGSGAGGLRDDGDRSPVMSGALPAPGTATRALPWDGSGAGAGANGSSSEIALMEELSRIDIGTGRARRHQGRYY